MRVLLIDDEENLLVVLEDLLAGHGHEVFCASNGSAGLKLLADVKPDVVVTDLRMEGMDGIEVVSHAAERFENVPVIVLTAFGDVESAVRAIKAGAVDYLTKPVNPEKFIIALKRAVQLRLKHMERFYLQAELEGRLGFSEFIGRSTAAAGIREFVRKAAASDAPVLITGETGAGKELVARLIHRESSRAGRLFVSAGCSKPSADLVLKDLFGSAGSSGDGSIGKFELADGGILFLDAISEIPKEVQGSLLKVLENGVVETGGRRPFRVDVRVIASAGKSGAELLKDGVIRPDLYHRLNVLSVDIPPLADRREDILPLSDWLLAQHAKRLGRAGMVLADEVRKALEHYSWPGNVRELSNVLERALVMCIDSTVKLTDLPQDIFGGEFGARDSASNLKDRIVAEERRLILESLEKHSFIQLRAAKALGISRSLLNQKIKRLGIVIPSGAAAE